MRFALDTLKKLIQAPSIKVGYKMIQFFVCDLYTFDCVIDRCTTCKDIKQFEKHLRTVDTFDFEVSL